MINPPTKVSPRVSVVDYNKLKEAGIMKVINIDGHAYISQKQFDPQTGLEITPAVNAVDIDQINDQITSLQTMLESMNTFIAECNAVLGTPNNS